MQVSQAIKQRISTRAFTDQTIDKSETKGWLFQAQRAPSGGNLQPWRVIALAGDAKQAVIDLAAEKLSANPRGEPTTYPIYPEHLTDAQKSRRRKVGEDMYAKLEIPRENKAGRMMWFARNFRFFDAPLALFFILDTRVGHGQWAHTGMFMQSLALLAEERGWGTCLQECWGVLRPSLHQHLGLAEHEMVYCGMAVGHPDKTAAVNQLYTERAALDEFADLRGF